MDVTGYLIKYYRLEPSTKYGSFGLNDYWYVAFLWGSAQLAGNEEQHGLSPASAIGDGAAAHRHGAEYVFLKCMDAVHRRVADDETDEEDDDDDDNVDKRLQWEERANEATTEERRRERLRPPLWLHSYQLWNLTALPRWDRVNDCLMAAFRWQVLDRFDVVRHLMFGELLQFAPNLRPPGMSFYDCIPAASVPYVKLCETDAKVNAEENNAAVDEDEPVTVGIRLHDSNRDVQAEEYE